MRFSSLVASALTLAAACSVAVTVPTTACSSAKACSDYFPPASFDATTPVVSFKTNVFPIFSNSCAFTTCHGAVAGSTNGIFLGGNDPEAVRTGIVNVKSDQLITMAFVTPGDPHNSYLMRKMDSSQCVLNSQCTNSDCQDSMPHNSDPLDVATRDTVRRWIQQGAQDN